MSSEASETHIRHLRNRSIPYPSSPSARSTARSKARSNGVLTPPATPVVRRTFAHPHSRRQRAPAGNDMNAEPSAPISAASPEEVVMPMLEERKLDLELFHIQDVHDTVTKARILVESIVKQNEHDDYMKKKKALCTCPGCSKLLVKPHSLDCGHTFCSACLDHHYFERTRLPSYACEPLCCPISACNQTILFGPVRNRNMEEIVKAFAAERDITIPECDSAYWPTIISADWEFEEYIDSTMRQPN